MTNYHIPLPTTTLPSLAVQEKKAARRKVIEAARKLERESYIAMMRRKRLLQEDSE